MKLRNIPQDGSQPELWQPSSDWCPPVGPLPRLEGAVVGVDTETRDDGLARGIGPGWVYHTGHLCGVSVAWDSQQLYVPVRHPDTECRPVGEVIEWLEHIFEHCEVHFFNAGYDLGWLVTEGLKVWPRRLHDASISTVMLDENQFEYGLDGCCERAGIAGKDPRLLEQAARSYGTDPKKGLWRLPGRYVGPYAEQDGVSTLQLSLHNLRRIQEQDQSGAYDTEIRLIRCLHDMRRRGIRINEDKAQQAIRKIEARRDIAVAEIYRLTGLRADMRSLRSPEALGKIFAAVDITCPRTPKTKLPSVDKAWLQALEHPIGHHVRSARRFDDLANKFIQGYILENLHRGRIHAEVHQLRDGEGGTRTHRLSYSNPPLQQTPARPDKDDPQEDKDLVTEVRSCFEAESGEEWFAPDYSGQEPRFLVHLAAACGMPGAEAMAQRYQENPRLDYHQTAANILGWPRAQAKDTNQGLAYGMGVDKLAKTLRCSVEEAEEKLEQYHSGMPYVRAATNHASNMAKSRGWIRLIDGARCHFDHWQPRSSGRAATPVFGLAAAQAKWPGKQLERAMTHKALNRACQGGAARQMKRAMVQTYEAGYLPLISMHDENGYSVTTKKACLEIQEIMINCVKLRVPMLVDMEAGPDWGHAKKSVDEVFE